MFDLNTVALKDAFELQLRHPATDELLWADEGKTQPVSIMLYGPSSKEYRNAMLTLQNKYLKRGKKQQSAEVMREEAIELLVACSADSKNLSRAGVPIKTDADFRSLYGDAAFGWLKDQVDAALGDPANFLGQ